VVSSIFERPSRWRMDYLERIEFYLISARVNRGKGDANPPLGTGSPVETRGKCQARRTLKLKSYNESSTKAATF
jgi:hypothetical protein